MTCRRSVSCWCVDCHRQRLERFQDLPLDRLFLKFKLQPRRESKALDIVFNETLNAAAYAKLIRLAINNIGFQYTKPYLNRYMRHLSDEERKVLAESINDAAWIFDNIATIQENFVQVRKDVDVDIRRLSLSELYQAKNQWFCHWYANMLASKAKKPDELAYTVDDFNIMVETMMQTTCFQAVDGDPTRVASLIGKLGQAVLQRMRHDF